jgi:vacuolar-type H+-ATPase subunit H
MGEQAMKACHRNTILLRVVLTLFFAFILSVPAHAGFFDKIVDGAKESIKKSTQESVDEAQKNIEESVEGAVQEAVDTVQQTTDETIDSVNQEVTDSVNNVNSTVSSTIDNTVNTTIDTFSGNRNPIAAIDVEGIFVGNNATIATKTLTSAGYQQISKEPLIFRKGANTLSVSTTNNKISSITLDGFASVNNAFVSDEKSRIEKALGKTCPPVQQASNWFCTLEGEANEYFLEFKVRRNKYSYVVEGSI